MTDSKAQWEPIGLERFGHLEDKIFRVVEAFKAVRKENDSLRADNLRLKNEIEAMRAQEASLQENLSHLQQEREELRERVEKALNLLSTVEMK